ncbi:MAG: hypothetical protein K8R68_01565 [Bacteroidales bacterium]|nr:hypothetical protein [Bacteroidales bacterium]
MFLITVTKNEISHNFRFSNIEELKFNSSKMTIVTDNFLTKFIMEEGGFSVVESPLNSPHDSKKNIFSQVKYDQDNKVLYQVDQSITTLIMKVTSFVLPIFTC